MITTRLNAVPVEVLGYVSTPDDTIIIKLDRAWPEVRLPQLDELGQVLLNSCGSMSNVPSPLRLRGRANATGVPAGVVAGCSWMFG